ncbi:MAG: rhodanese-like domain-containing protein [Pseudomonadota bacterium]
MMRRADLLAGIGYCGLALAACAPQSDDDGGGEVLPFPEMAAAAELEVREGLGQTGADIAAQNDKLIEISAEELAEQLAAENIRLIDVRTDEEVAEGMIPGAEHIAKDDFDPATVLAGDDRPIILYCRSGGRSGQVAEKLAAHTGKPVTHLAGGILAWQASGKDIAAQIDK